MVEKIKEREFKIPPEINRAIKAMGNKNRKEIIEIIGNNKKATFSDILNHLNLTSSTLTFHLKELKKASLIDNFYQKSEDSNRYSYYVLTEFAKDFLKALGLKIN